jgi:hypothetical protein
MPNETETLLVGAAGGLERAFWRGPAPLRVIIGERTLRHHLPRLLEPADQTAVFAINENDSLPTLYFV